MDTTITSKRLFGKPSFDNWSLWFYTYDHPIFNIELDRIMGAFAINIYKWGLELNWPCDYD